jgi:hypothetical protein
MIDPESFTPPATPEEAFASVVALRRLAAALERSAVDEALRQGWTWAQIGRSLDLSPQAAHKRLAPSHRKPTTS